MSVNPDRFTTFCNIYSLCLAEAVVAHPSDYPWAKPGAPYYATIETVASRMHAAIQRNTYNKDSHAFRATCRKLGIPCTYKAIDAYLERSPS